MFLLPQVGVHEEHLRFVNPPPTHTALWGKGGPATLLYLNQTNILASDGDLVIPKVKDLLEPAAGITAGLVTSLPGSS